MITLRSLLILPLFITARCNESGEWLNCKAKPGCSFTRCDPKPSQWVERGGEPDEYSIMCQKKKQTDGSDLIWMVNGILKELSELKEKSEDERKRMRLETKNLENKLEKERNSNKERIATLEKKIAEFEKQADGTKTTNPITYGTECYKYEKVVNDKEEYFTEGKHIAKCAPDSKCAIHKTSFGDGDKVVESIFAGCMRADLCTKNVCEVLAGASPIGAGPIVTKCVFICCDGNLCNDDESEIKTRVKTPGISVSGDAAQCFKFQKFVALGSEHVTVEKHITNCAPDSKCSLTKTPSTGIGFGIEVVTISGKCTRNAECNSSCCNGNLCNEG